MKKLITQEFNDIMKRHIFETINYILKEGIEFGILVRVENLTFEPKLPTIIEGRFSDITYFIVAEYTFKSAVVNQNYLTFEAGFGEDNFASNVTIPLLSIVQLLINENPILLNVAVEQTADAINRKKAKRVEKSKNIFLKNPKNKDLWSERGE